MFILYKFLVLYKMLNVDIIYLFSLLNLNISDTYICLNYFLLVGTKFEIDKKLYLNFIKYLMPNKNLINIFLINSLIIRKNDLKLCGKPKSSKFKIWSSIALKITSQMIHSFFFKKSNPFKILFCFIYNS